jgi:hypothetical protein
MAVPAPVHQQAVKSKPPLVAAKTAKSAAPVVEIDEDQPPRPRSAGPRPAVKQRDDSHVVNGERLASRALFAAFKRGRIPKPIGIATAAGFLLLVTIVLGIFLLNRSSAVGPTLPGDLENRIAADDLVVTVRDMLKEFESNEPFAERKYQGSVVAVSGFVGRCSKDEENRYFLELKPSRAPAGMTVKCLFRFRHETEVRAIAQGSTIQIRGLCEGKNGSWILLKDCRLVGTAAELENILEDGPTGIRRH